MKRRGRWKQQGDLTIRHLLHPKSSRQCVREKQHQHTAFSSQSAFCFKLFWRGEVFFLTHLVHHRLHPFTYDFLRRRSALLVTDRVRFSLNEDLKIAVSRNAEPPIITCKASLPHWSFSLCCTTQWDVNVSLSTVSGKWQMKGEHWCRCQLRLKTCFFHYCWRWFSVFAMRRSALRRRTWDRES